MRIGGNAYIIVFFLGIPKIQRISSSRELNTTNGCQKHQRDLHTKIRVKRVKQRKKIFF